LAPSFEVCGGRKRRTMLRVLIGLLALTAVAREEAASERCCPGLVFAKDSCNSCICSPAGLKNGSRCTTRACQQTPEKVRCDPLTSFAAGDGLNTCLCPTSGLIAEARCTKLACPEMPHSESVLTATRQEEGSCCPGLIFDAADGCNTCHCGSSGLRNESACTLMACPPMFVPSDRCTPMMQFPAGDGLNMCTCPWSGLKAEASCTTFECPEETPSPVLEEGQCCPGLTFGASDGCNTCRCAESGLRNESACTRLACPPSPMLREGLCIPLLSFPAGDGINSCFCPINGRREEAECTSHACPEVPHPVPPTSPPLPEEGSCCPGLSFTAADGCNRCMCADSGLKNESACTRMACPPWMQSLRSDCTPFAGYPAGDGLNTCVCPANGVKSPEHCTRLECPFLPGDGTSGDGDDDGCCPGVRFPASDGCNTCICPASGNMSDPAPCTLMACPPLPRPELPAGRCHPFESFHKGDGTNTCTCPPSGLKREARCTSLPCPYGTQARDPILP